MLECYLVFAAVCTYLAIYSDIPDGTHEATPWFVRVAWFLQTIALSSSIYITVVRLVDPNGVTGGGGYWVRALRLPRFEVSPRYSHPKVTSFGLLITADALRSRRGDTWCQYNLGSS